MLLVGIFLYKIIKNQLFTNKFSVHFEMDQV